jgi:hypothetical protein
MSDSFMRLGRGARAARRGILATVFCISLWFAACVGGAENGDGESCPTASGSGGGTSGAGAAPQSLPAVPFEHFNVPFDPYGHREKQLEEGPPEIRSRLRSCTRMPYATLGAFLSSRGVDLAAEAPAGEPPTAGQLYKRDALALGAHYYVRQPEAYFYSTPTAFKTFDIFVQAAAEIIANIADAAACKLDGVGRPMFDDDGNCVPESLTCLLGRPAKSEDLEICAAILAAADPSDPVDVDMKRRVAVAAFLSAAHTCE